MSLAVLRASKKLSQTEVAKHLGVSLKTYQRYEHGYTEPSSSTLKRLAELYGTTMDALAAVLVAKKGSAA